MSRQCIRDTHIMFNYAVQQADGSYLHDDGDTVWYNRAGTAYHREDGPAVIRQCGIECWYYLGVEYHFDFWCMLTNKTDEDKMMLRLQYG
jgi:hypothetical protein